MGAPSGTTWGNIVGSGPNQGRIGICISISLTSTQTKVAAQIWYWTRNRVQDTSNNFYYDWDSYADTSIGSRSINTTSNNGTWSETNQIYIGEYSKTFDRGSSDQTKQFSARFSGIEYGGESGTHNISFTIPALDTYTIKYNANGGSGAPQNQIKTHGTNIILSGTKPTKTGYTFMGWGTSESDTTVDYVPGETYTANASITLYAVWNLNIYTITFNATENGGTGNTTRTVFHGGKLSSIPEASKEYNKFLGWYTAKTGGTKITTDTVFTSNMTVYAQFELDVTIPIYKGRWYQGIPYVGAGGWKQGNMVAIFKDGEWKGTENIEPSDYYTLTDEDGTILTDENGMRLISIKD